MRLLDGKRRRKEHDKGRQGWRSLAWALLFLSDPPRRSPAPHSQPTGGVEGSNFLKPFSGCFFFLDDNKSDKP